MKEVQKNLRTEQMENLIENISAYIEQYHGGSAELVSFEDDVVRVRLGGACLGCPLSTATLKGWVQGTIHQFFPDVKVEAAD
jgi:Fe-S cluster biogenesis protein NfuA